MAHRAVKLVRTTYVDARSSVEPIHYVSVGLGEPSVSVSLSWSTFVNLGRPGALEITPKETS